MKRQVKEIIRENIYNNNSSFNDNKEITKSLRIESLIRLVLSLSFFIFIMIFNEKITKLSIITSDTILNHIVFFRPDILFFFVLALALFLNLLSFSFTFYAQTKVEALKTKFYYFGYRIYDFISFSCSLIIIIDFIILFLITPVTVAGESMNNTLNNGDKCLIWHFMYEPKNDDIIILDAKKYSGQEKFFVKRIVASEGDTIRIQGLKNSNYYYFSVNDTIVEKRFTLSEWAHITGENVSLDKPYINHTFVIPKNKYVIMGDNRANSLDSRYFGLIDKCDIIGRLVLRYYPFNVFGTPDKKLCEVL